jgi:hypothetical protein
LLWANRLEVAERVHTCRVFLLDNPESIPTDLMVAMRNR